MNKIIFPIAFLLLFLFSISAKAQEVKTYTQTMDSLLASVDKKDMKTSILYDRIFPFANLKNQKDTTDFEYFRQAYSELHRASYNLSFKNVDEIYSKLKNNKENLDVVPLGIIDASFDYLNEKNIEKKDESFVVKSTTGLFLQKEISLIAPLKKWVASTSKIVYTLPSEFIILENNRKIKRLEVSFDNGQNIVWIEEGQKLYENIEVDYKDRGNKFITFKITFDDEKVFVQKTQIDIRLYSVNSTERNWFPLEEDFIEDRAIVAATPFTGYDENLPITGGLEYRVYYNLRDNDTKKKSYNKKTYYYFRWI